MRICVIENSEDLARYFVDHTHGIDVDVFPVWKDPVFPHDDYDAYVLTGDYHNISDGLLPFHETELEFIDTVRGKRIFASCFAHQLVARRFGGKVGKRELRLLGWHPALVKEPHPVFKGIGKKPYFLSLNGDEVTRKPASARVLATNPDCSFQILLYDDILTCQAHPEILYDDAISIMRKHRARLADRCPDMDDLIRQTAIFANDNASRRFMRNVMEWLLA